MGRGGATPALQLNIWLEDVRQNTVMSNTASFHKFHSSPHCNSTLRMMIIIIIIIIIITQWP
jgi:hypothetical protein